MVAVFDWVELAVELAVVLAELVADEVSVVDAVLETEEVMVLV